MRVLALVRKDPRLAGLAQTRWSFRELTGVAIKQRLVRPISKSRVHEWLVEAGLQPHRRLQWLTSHDPDFDRKAADVADLYFNPPPCAARLCVDEKPGMQALERLNPPLPMQPGIPERVEFEYRRHGTVGMFGGLNIATGEVLAKCVETRGVDEFIGYLDQIVDAYPRGTVHCVLDNLNIHKHSRVENWRARHRGRFVFHFLPTHASWLNQIENWFGILQQKCLSRASFPSKAALVNQVMRFTREWNRVQKHPFKWRPDADWVRSCRGQLQ